MASTSNTRASSHGLGSIPPHGGRSTLDMVQLATFELHNPEVHPYEVADGLMGTAAIRDTILTREYQRYDIPISSSYGVLRSVSWDILPWTSDIALDRTVLLDTPWETLESLLEATRPGRDLSDYQ